MTVSLLYLDLNDRISAAQFIAELVRQGVIFSAVASVSGSSITITFNGGF